MFEINLPNILTLIAVSIYLCVNSYANAESCQGAIVQNGTNRTIDDANNDTWKIRSGDTIDKNGQPAGFSAAVVKLVYWDKIVYQSNQYGGWWGWINNGWVGVNDHDLISNLTSALGCMHAILIESSSSPITVTIESNAQPIPYFVPQSCNDPNYIGHSCNISMKPCDLLKPCQNLGHCMDDPSVFRGYSCMCMPGFNGTHCEFNIQLCQPKTCLHNGTCKELNNISFDCNCTQGHTGTHCEILINHCNNATCLNKGVCRSLLLDYTCECLSGGSGRQCEYMATNIIIRQYVSKGFSYIAILVILSVAGFIIILDILKYVFGIDLAQKERDQIRRQRASRGRNNCETRKSQQTNRLRRTNKVTPIRQPHTPKTQERF